MELFHRRQRMAALEDKVERLSKLEADNAELQDMNEQLLQELEKRDHVIEEAVGMICVLEDKIESLKAGAAAPASPRPSAHKTSSSGWTPTSPSSSPSASMRGQRAVTGLESDTRAGMVRSFGKTGRASDEVADEPPSRRPPPARCHSYLASKGRGSSALRSLFAAGERERQPSSWSRAPSNSDTALTAESMTGASDDGDDDDEVPEMPDSPGLSVLSESSFLSVYGGRIPSEREGHRSDAVAVEDEDEDEPLGPPLPRSTPLEPWEDRPISSRIESWMSERPRRTLSIRPASTAASRQEELGSAGDEIDDERPASGRSVRAVRDPAEQGTSLPPTTAGPNRKRQRQFDPPSLHGPIFAGGKLPPTPDTLSTVDMDSVNTSSSNVTAKGVSDGSPESTGGQWPQISAQRPRGVSDLGASHHADLSRQLARQGLELEPIRLDSLHQVPLRLEAGGAGRINASRLRRPTVDARRTLKEAAALQVGVRSVATSAVGRDEKPAGQATDSTNLRGRSYADDHRGRAAHPSSQQPFVQPPASPASESIRPSMKQRGAAVDVPVSCYALPLEVSDDEASDTIGGYASESSARRSGPPQRAPRPRLKPNVSDGSRRLSLSRGSPKSGGLASRLFGRSSSSNPAGRRRMSNQDLAVSGSLAALTNAPRFLDAIGRSLSVNLVPDAIAGTKSAGATSQPVVGGLEASQRDSQISNSIGTNKGHNGLVVDSGGRTVTVSMTSREPAHSGGLDVTEADSGRPVRPPGRTSIVNSPIPRRIAQPVHSSSQQRAQFKPQGSGPIADLRRLAKAAAPESPDSSKNSESRSRIRWSLGRSNSAVLP